jgi:hypothetical protein
MRLFGLYPSVRGALTGIGAAAVLAGLVDGVGFTTAGAAAAVVLPLVTLAALRVLDHADDRTLADYLALDPDRIASEAVAPDAVAPGAVGHDAVAAASGSDPAARSTSIARRRGRAVGPAAAGSPPEAVVPPAIEPIVEPTPAGQPPVG